MTMIRSLLIWCAVGVYTMVVASLALAAWVLPAGRERSERYIPRWARGVLRIAGVPTLIEGLEHFEGVGSCVVVANHESALDIPGCLSHLPGRVRMMAKESLFRVPIFGWLLRLEGFVPVDRKRIDKARRSVGPAEKALSKGMRLFVFPEGTRSRTGELGIFKTGAFRIALRAGVPVIPVCIVGAREILPAKAVRLRPGAITIVVGPPIPTLGSRAEDRHAIRSQARAWIEATKARYAGSSPDGAVSPNPGDEVAGG